jgi:hypothetical protein
VTRLRSLLVLALLLALVAVAGAGPASAQEPADQAPSGLVPAGTVPPSDQAAEDEAWTFRFLVPTLLALAGLTLAAVVLFYGVRVRGRYRVVR